MSARVICFASAKGGSGKTVITATIGSFLAALGKRVLLIDTDAATNGLTLLYIKEVLAQGAQRPPDQQSLVGLFEGDEASVSVTHVELAAGVHLVPATYQFVNTEGRSPEHFERRLAMILQRNRENYDYILLDAQAGADVYASIAMNKQISDVVVLVAEYDPMSAAGIERLKGLMRDDLTYARTWILLNKVLPEFAKNFSDFLEVARYLSPIPWDADVVRAYARRRLALDTENGNSFTLAVMQTVRSLLGEEIESDIRNWTQTRAEAIRQPIDVQYSKLERELAAIVLTSAQMERSGKLRSLILRAAVIAVSVTTVAMGIVWWQEIAEGYLGPLRLTIIGVLIAIGFTFSLSALRYLMERGKLVNLELERASIIRRREVVEDTLRKLETLRVAEPEFLLRSRKEV